MRIVVRPGRREDRDTIVGFQLRMAMETEGLELDRETVRLGVKAVFDDPAKGQYWVAERSGEVIGGLLTVPEWSDWRNGTVLWIHSVYVMPEMREQGVFRSLYEQLKKRVETAPELKGLRLYVEKENGRAQKVYERMGMDGNHYRLYEWMKQTV